MTYFIPLRFWPAVCYLFRIIKLVEIHNFIFIFVVLFTLVIWMQILWTEEVNPSSNASDFYPEVPASNLVRIIDYLEVFILGSHAVNEAAVSFCDSINILHHKVLLWKDNCQETGYEWTSEVRYLAGTECFYLSLYPNILFDSAGLVFSLQTLSAGVKLLEREANHSRLVSLLWLHGLISIFPVHRFAGDRE